MTGPVDEWVFTTLHRLACLTMNKDGTRALAAAPIRLVRMAEVRSYAGPPAILLPVDVDAPLTPPSVKAVEFGGTKLTIMNPVERESSWTGDGGRGAWWHLASGSITPSWNLWGTVRNLLLLREEVDLAIRDRHGRFPITASPRLAAGLTQVPVVNEALALLVDASLYFVNDRPLLTGLEDVVQPPIVVLSHDCDSLAGNGIWDQVTRVNKLLTPLMRARTPDWRQLRHIASNMAEPQKGYLGDLRCMWELERSFDFPSVSYILNGRAGRYGARSSFQLSAQAILDCPSGSEIGIHYNYGYLDSARHFEDQVMEIESILGYRPVAGRAHYLKFDPHSHAGVVASGGIRIDESVGWISRNSYRVGIAGPFKPFDSDKRRAVDVIEFPLVFSDSDIAREDGSSSTWSAMFRHITKIGGCVSVLVHPGAFASPERPDMAGVYNRVLSDVANANSRVVTPSQLADEIGRIDSGGSSALT